MRRLIVHSIALCLLVLCSFSVNAENIVHNFDDMYGVGQIEIPDATHVTTTTDDVVYTLGGGATLFYDYAHPMAEPGGMICLNLTNNEDFISTSQVFDKLGSIRIHHLSNATNNALDASKLKVQLSLDGSDWTSITPSVTYNKGNIVVETLPGAYYVKIKKVSSSSTKISVWRMEYTSSDCNCFRYVE